VKLLRSVYGKQFVQISIYAPEEYRIKGIESKELHSWRGLGSEVDARNGAYALVNRMRWRAKRGLGRM
jgi:cytidine deaminase